MVDSRDGIQQLHHENFPQTDAVDLLAGLVSIPSLSREEGTAVDWLVEKMGLIGFTRTYVDEAGNAVGEMGTPDADRTVVLLGHIDTVPGAIPVRIARIEDGEVLFGRGAVDAKGPLATFVAAVARLGHGWAVEHDLRLVVVGAVEEEAATSKGARHIRARFDGACDPIPHACIIGEPSSAHRVTLGYKGRLLIELEAAQPMAHTAGPDAGVATVAVDFWNRIAAHAAAYNADRPKAFDQLLPSLRELGTETDAEMNDRVHALAGVRLPIGFDVSAYAWSLIEWGSALVGAPVPDRAAVAIGDGARETAVTLRGEQIILTLRFRGHEAAWRSDRNNALVRSFLAAVRSRLPDTRPGFVVKTGTSDMNVVGPVWQCPILAYGPGDSSLDHTPNEHLRLDEYWQAVLVLEEALRVLAGAL